MRTRQPRPMAVWSIPNHKTIRSNGHSTRYGCRLSSRIFLQPFLYSAEFGEDFMGHQGKPIERDNKQWTMNYGLLSMFRKRDQFYALSQRMNLFFFQLEKNVSIQPRARLNNRKTWCRWSRTASTNRSTARTSSLSRNQFICFFPIFSCSIIYFYRNSRFCLHFAIELLWFVVGRRIPCASTIYLSIFQLFVIFVLNEKKTRSDNRLSFDK